jgi:hypothetical protein
VQKVPLSIWVNIPYHIALAVAFLQSRSKTALNILLALLAVLLSVLGAVAGLVPLAVLTTRPGQKSLGNRALMRR